jgi:hypothetical protein
MSSSPTSNRLSSHMDTAHLISSASVFFPSERPALQRGSPRGGVRLGWGSPARPAGVRGSSSSPAWHRVKGHPKEGDSGPIAPLQTWRDWSCSGARFLSPELARVPGPKIPHATKSCWCVWRARPPELDLALACTTATTELHAQTSLMTTFSLLLPHCWHRSSMRTIPHPKRDVPIR